MLTYQVRPRALHFDGPQLPQFPAPGEVRFHLAPPQPFGVEAGGGRTAVKNCAASVLFNSNTGEHTIESKPALQPLDVTLTGPDHTVRLEGRTLTVAQVFDSSASLTRLIEAVYFGIPALLAVDFADPPIVERVDGSLHGIPFRWALVSWQTLFLTTTQEVQERAFATAWENLPILAPVENRRLFAALHYFQVAVRLSRAASIAGEFLPETILNYSKVLEVLFPPTGDVKSRDAARQGLALLGFSSDDIEANYIPAMALRNEIDVGHVELGIFSVEQLGLIHGYVEQAELAFRKLMTRVVHRVKDGSFRVPQYEFKPANGSTLKVLEALHKNFRPRPL